MKFLFRIILVAILIINSSKSSAQGNGVLSGTILDKSLQKPIVGVSIQIIPSRIGTTSDTSGKFRITGIKPGAYSITITRIGYNAVNKYNVSITSGNENNLVIEMEPSIAILNDVSVTSTNRNKSAKAATLETPLSVQRLVINHFATQGSAGGPAGILNVSFIEEVKLSSSSFDARFDNALSSVFEFKRNDDNTAFLTTNGAVVQQNGSNAIPLLLKNDNSNFRPTFGFIIEF